MCDESTQEYCGDQFTPTSELNLKFISFIPSKTLCSASFFCLLRMRTSSRFPTLYPPSNIPLPGVAGAAWEPSEQEHSSCPLTHIVAFLTTPSPPPLPLSLCSLLAPVRVPVFAAQLPKFQLQGRHLLLRLLLRLLPSVSLPFILFCR